MDIPQMQVLKRDLERKIEAAINEFQDTTKVSVSGIYYDPVDVTMAQDVTRRTYPRIEITVQL